MPRTCRGSVATLTPASSQPPHEGPGRPRGSISDASSMRRCIKIGLAVNGARESSTFHHPGQPAITSISGIKMVQYWRFTSTCAGMCVSSSSERTHCDCDRQPIGQDHRSPHRARAPRRPGLDAERQVLRGLRRRGPHSMGNAAAMNPRPPPAKPSRGPQRRGSVGCNRELCRDASHPAPIQASSGRRLRLSLVLEKTSRAS